MTAEQRDELKWVYLLEKCEVRLHILGPTSLFPRAMYNVLSIQHYRDEEEKLTGHDLV